MSKKVLGIDLGTTYSCVAYVGESGKPTVLPNSDGERTTPSAVWFDADRVVVGNEAKGMAPVCPREVATFVKREMGNTDYTFACSRGDLRAEEISSYILRKLVKDACAELGEDVRDVVITCPAYFSFKEREATKNAGLIAGLNVLEILNEPTAAAIAYGHSGKAGDTTKHVLVYDLGGGTFDVTLISVAADGINVVCTDGNHRLGGKDWDGRITKLLIDKFQRATGNMQDLYSDDEAMQELAQMSERTKKALSTATETAQVFNYKGEKHRLTITREEFEQETEDLLNETVDFTESVLEAARRKGVNHVDELILVGGSTRMPQVQRALRSCLGMEPKIYDPDEAVAKGAAIVGAAHALRQKLSENLGGDFVLEGQTAEDGFSLEVQDALREVAEESGYTLEAAKKLLTPTSNVCSKGFGMQLCRRRDDVLRVYNLIYKDTNLPIEAKMTSCTRYDDQEFVRITIVENEQAAPVTQDEIRSADSEGFDPEDSTPIWEGDLQIMPGLPAGSEIHTVFNLDSSGLLHVLTRDPASGREITADIKTDCSIDNEELMRMRRRQDRDIIE